MAEPGDMIEIKRDDYQHWALFVGNGDVIHLTGDATEEEAIAASSGSANTVIGIVKKQKLKEVALGDQWLVHNYLDYRFKPKSQDVILKEAEQQVDKEIRYDLISYNCEHFVTNLRYGKPKSRQVLKVMVAKLKGSISISSKSL